MKGTYKYMSDTDMADHYPRLYEELIDFYDLLEKYKEDKTRSNKHYLENQRNDLFFAIKHLVVFGELSRPTADEIQDYIGGLLERDYCQQVNVLI